MAAADDDADDEEDGGGLRLRGCVLVHSYHQHRNIDVVDESHGSTLQTGWAGRIV